jgi:hypothetical protein
MLCNENSCGAFWKVEIMLIVCNGAPKGGSTWLVQIIQNLPNYRPIPDKYRNEKWMNPSFASRETVETFLNTEDIRQTNYFCKQHWYNDPQDHSLLECPKVRILNIIRDIRDVFVSRFFHDTRVGEFDGTFDQYVYSDRGTRGLKEYINYQRFWHDREPQPTLLCYEQLHKNFSDQFSLLAKSIGLEPDQAQLDHIRRQTDVRRHIESSKESDPAKRFFRRGEPGDWRNHFSTEQLAHFRSLLHEFRWSELACTIEKRWGYQVAMP